MQLIEVSDFGVRSAEIWLSRVETPLRFVLFPMLHLGTAAYYEAVTRLGLTTQQMDLSSLNVPMVNPDVTGQQLDAGWRRLPVFFRLAVWALVPIFWIWMALVGTRAALARYLGG